MGKPIAAVLTALYLLSVAAAPVTAGSITGSLIVTTTVPVACAAPSPSGNLNLPLSTSGDLATGQDISPEVRVTIVCTGHPVIEGVTFGDGLYADDKASGTKIIEKFRAMKRNSVANDGTKTHYLGYKLYASKQSGFAVQDQPGTLMKTTQDDPTEGTLPLGDRGTATFYLKARIYEKNADRAYKKASDIPAGGHTDAIIMTVTYF